MLSMVRFFIWLKHSFKGFFLFIGMSKDYSTRPTWKQINIYQKYASPFPAFSHSTICCLIKNKKMKIFYWVDFFNAGLKLHGQNRLFKGVQNQDNQI